MPSDDPRIGEKEDDHLGEAIEKYKQEELEKYNRIERGGSSRKPHRKYPSNYTPPKKRKRKK